MFIHTHTHTHTNTHTHTHQASERLAAEYTPPPALGLHTTLLRGVSLREHGGTAPASDLADPSSARGSAATPTTPTGGAQLVLSSAVPPEVVRQVRALREEAWRCFDLADGVDEASYNRGLLLLETGDTLGAGSQFEQATRKNPQFCDALVNLGVTLEARQLQAQVRPTHARRVCIHARGCSLFRLSHASLLMALAPGTGSV